MASIAPTSRPSAALMERADRPILSLPRLPLTAPWPSTDPGVEESSVFAPTNPSEVVSPTRINPAENGGTIQVTVDDAADAADAADEPNYLLWGGLIAGGVLVLGAGTYFALKKK